MKQNTSLSLKLCQKKLKIKKLDTRNINKRLKRINIWLKSKTKLTFKLAENMEHLQEQAIRLQNYLEKKLDSKKGFVTTKQKQGNWKLMKLKN